MPQEGIYSWRDNEFYEHKMMKRRGQGALEYLQTYGWAIIIVFVIGIALWRFGVFSPGASVNTASGFTKIRVPEAGIVYYPNTWRNALNFTIMNGYGDFVRIDAIRISGDCNGTTYPLSALDAGATMIVSGWNCSVMYEREKFYVDVNITYSTKLGKERIQHTDAGVIRGAAD